MNLQLPERMMTMLTIKEKADRLSAKVIELLQPVFVEIEKCGIDTPASTTILIAVQRAMFEAMTYALTEFQKED